MARKFKLVFQIVLPSQAREMYEVVKNKGLPTALIMYEGKMQLFSPANSSIHICLYSSETIQANTYYMLTVNPTEESFQAPPVMHK